MLRHILTIILRTTLTSKLQFITIMFGLTASFVVTLLIHLYVTEEKNYDKLFKYSQRIYRVNTTLDLEGKVDHTAKAGLNTGEVLMGSYPEIESFTQLLNVGKQTIKVGENLYSSDKVVYADSTFFEFFNFPFIAGTASEALLGPNKAVVSSAIAKTYFGNEQAAVGRVMNINKKDFTVSGVYDERFSRTHIPHHIFLSLASLPQPFLEQRNLEFMWLTTFNYILLREGTDAAALQQKFESFNKSHLIPYAEKNQLNGSVTHQLEAVTDIHLDNTLRFDFPTSTNPSHLKILSGVAIMILFIALINYVNLTTAKVTKRLKEIGIKKSVGATKRNLLLQFFAETITIVFISFLLALTIATQLLPELNKLTDRNFFFSDITGSTFIIAYLVFILGFGLIAGVYPALVLSNFNPIQALKSSGQVGDTSMIKRIINPGNVRKVLVTLQFSISIFLIIGTIVVYNQFNYLRNLNMGFNQEQVMVIDIPNDTTVSNNIHVIKNSFASIASVKSVSASSSVPGSDHGALTMNVSQSGGSEVKVINVYFTDETFLETLDIGLDTGRYFSKDFSTDPQNAFVINEAAASFLGWKPALEKKIVSPLGQEGTVVGVVKNFNYKSLHSAIDPLIIMNIRNSQGYLLVRIETGNLRETIRQISDAWKAFDPSHPYEYFFLDEKFNEQYVKEERLVKVFTYFSVLTILISCLGLTGLAIFTTQLKTKEIAIRKILGASHTQLLGLLSREFLILIILSNIISWPLSYLFVSDWLTDFAYKTTIGIIPFIAGTTIALLIAALTISYFTNKAANGSIHKALKQD